MKTEKRAILERMASVLNIQFTDIIRKEVMAVVAYTTHEEYKELKAMFLETYGHGNMYETASLDEIGVDGFLLDRVVYIGVDFKNNKPQFPAGLEEYKKIYFPIMRTSLNDVPDEAYGEKKVDIEKKAILDRIQKVLLTSIAKFTVDQNKVGYTTHENYKVLKDMFREVYGDEQMHKCVHSDPAVPHFKWASIPKSDTGSPSRELPIVGCDFVDDKPVFPKSLKDYHKIYLPTVR